MSTTSISPLNEPLTLPSGLQLPNRLAKAAMAEDLAQNSNPTSSLSTLYTHWASGSWGMLLTGNIMINSSQRGSPHDVCLPHALATTTPTPSPLRDQTLALWKSWADAIQAHGSPAIIQVNHPGRQAARFMRSGSAIAPSPIPLDLGPGLLQKIMSFLAFGTPREMTQADIDDVVLRFAATARLASDAGFKGMQIHAAHGYLLAQFLSPHSNKRTDGYGGSAANRARILRDVVAAIRAAVPRSFTLGIKLNSADFMEGNRAGGLEDVLAQIREVAGLESGVDFLEISGGSYENPRMMGPEFDRNAAAAASDSTSTSTSTSSSTSAADKTRVETEKGNAPVSARTANREAFFLDFAQEVRRHFPQLTLMVTGGFRSREGMRAALESGACDIVGLGRPGVVTPRVPKEVLLNEGVADRDAVVKMKAISVPWLLRVLGMKGIGGGLVTVAYQRDIKKLVTFSST